MEGSSLLEMLTRSGYVLSSASDTPRAAFLHRQGTQSVYQTLHRGYTPICTPCEKLCLHVLRIRFRPIQRRIVQIKSRIPLQILQRYINIRALQEQESSMCVYGMMTSTQGHGIFEREIERTQQERWRHKAHDAAASSGSRCRAGWGQSAGA